MYQIQRHPLSVYVQVGDNTNTSNSNSVNATTSRRMAPPPGLSAAWSVEGLEVGMGGGRFQEEEDPCAICTDELSSAPVQTLDCGHRFHDQVSLSSYLCVCLPVYVPVFMSVFLSICLSSCLSSCPSACLPACLSPVSKVSASRVADPSSLPCSSHGAIQGQVMPMA